MLLPILAGVGTAGIALSLVFLRAAKSKGEREARRRADLIRQRLQEQPQVVHRKVEIRLGRGAGG
jgi:hypothetical protein